MEFYLQVRIPDMLILHLHFCLKIMPLLSVISHCMKLHVAADVLAMRALSSLMRN